MLKNLTVDDVMTTKVISVPPDAPYRTVVDTLIAHRVSAVPVVDDFLRVLGVVSEADLLNKIEYAGDEPRLFESRKRRRQRGKSQAATARDLMTAPAIEAISGVTTIAAAARRMNEHDVKRLPVVDDLGRLVGIVSRGDLLKVHLRPDDDIRVDVENDVLGVFLAEESTGVGVTVSGGVVTVTGAVERWSTRDIVERHIRRIPGVVDVVSQLTYEFDDRTMAGPGLGFGIS
ncbi:BON domain-containing protein [Krasilnikovia cinnamomea]|uniref:BON domain-containing protein n=1 Tax=Krasilnikovia cinnamomea TaxID=349313 RepID=A0A4Q7ZRW2_9ACTN|nr:CBS domain-containing protein [Krasilnikovia cinnamomea]RZU53551.1 BON domain-containing protein [Krasilnikovia cinnamomea]